MLCRTCPRDCGALRNEADNLNGYCKMPSSPVVAKAYLHMWEEPCISGKNGSGTVFFSGCSLGCVFCQNIEISHKNKGKHITIERLAEIFKELYEAGAENINLVNPTHYVYTIKKAFEIYRPPIPVVYNSGGYDTEEGIAVASEFTDIFLMDLKYLDPSKALRYSKAENYPSVATKAIRKCASIVGENIFDENGILKKGLIIRHLILPLGTNEAISVIKWVEQNAKRFALSLMSQYTPCGDLEEYPELTRKITKREYDKVLTFASESDIDVIFTQELSSSSKDYIPTFDFLGV